MSEESTTPDLLMRVRAIFEVVNDHDWDAILSHYAPTACWDARHLGTTFDGHDAIRGVWQEWADLYEDLAFELQELVDLRHGIVLAVALLRGHPVGSSGTIEAREAWVYEGRDGMIERVTVYLDIDEARAAAQHLAEERG